MLKSTLILAALVQLSPGQGDFGSEVVSPRSSDGRPTSPAVEYSGVARQLDVAAPVLASPDISIDGRLDEVAWERAAILTGFSQYEPVEGTPASEQTTVRMIVTEDALYFAIRAEDSSGGVRATLTQRDGYGRSDDYVRVILDTFNDQRRAYVFMVNPYGVQGDGLWVEGGSGRFGDPIDWNPDFLWESNGRIEDRKSTRLNSSHSQQSRMPSSA